MHKMGWLLALVLTTSCGGLEEDELIECDGREESFLSAGKADTAGIKDGTPEAQAVLAVANQASLAELKASAGVGLHAQAAQAIVSGRPPQGFASLAELDAVPYVGPLAVWKLLEYATRTGYLAAAASIYGEGEVLAVGGAQFVLHDQLLIKQVETAVGSGTLTTALWQLHVKATHLSYDAQRSRLIALGPKHLYIINPAGWIEQVFNEGYADIPNFSWNLLATSGVCVIYKNLGSYYRGRSFGSFMVGNAFLGYSYQLWALTFENLVKLYC